MYPDRFAMFDQQGKLIYYLGTQYDVTEKMSEDSNRLIQQPRVN